MGNIRSGLEKCKKHPLAKEIISENTVLCVGTCSFENSMLHKYVHLNLGYKFFMCIFLLQGYIYHGKE
jgi:hypothetical protein